ncbi:hypothetical protein BVRB_9g224780 [Beta vulgaris subsp. vulgaris]|uniref:Uncharacterized protein n=1 Tax=Beta vulgaris subsp. vulgaris TaxID=3555 RepID=A0A0J8B9F7_BETVV|nr:hypothetical protein BVRB_9g224780 [Beta vulgaris subsp. vulgaris]
MLGNMMVDRTLNGLWSRYYLLRWWRKRHFLLLEANEFNWHPYINILVSLSSAFPNSEGSYVL